MRCGVRRGFPVRLTVLAAAAAALLCLGCFTSVASASPGAYKVLFLYGEGSDGCNTTTLQTQLNAEPGVASVSSFDASTGTPSDATLDQYDMVVTMADCGGYQDGTAIGNNLADYADQGGVVVEYAYSMEDFIANELLGRWLSGGYSPLVPGSAANTDVTLGVIATSPLMAGVNSLVDDDKTSATLAAGATSVALWNNGAEAVAYKGRAVAVNASVDGSATWSGDFARLTLNAVTWLGRHDLTVGKSGSGSGTVTSNVGVSRVAPPALCRSTSAAPSR